MLIDLIRNECNLDNWKNCFRNNHLHLFYIRIISIIILAT